MLELKAAQFLPKVAQNVSTAVLLKIDVLQNSPKGHTSILATLVRKFVTENFQKSPNLVTLTEGHLFSAQSSFANGEWRRGTPSNRNTEISHHVCAHNTYLERKVL